ncbi:N-acetylglutamate synthase [Austwickia chelonae]|uniref:Putative acetyltransferase n=1 Tax=Austwickia chelonae NBRC 105200 TaxID=1184607 RepID=K6VJL1_9MICO|nr:amino-acid N-acetyltransferase [Austwickia chelonae]GAB76924.1 putative acetyltransferase [Austwickia chelonae NBRC 105200]SEW32413.1 N-acetylglutamate synthase [Austwickia chelonae]
MTTDDAPERTGNRQDAQGVPAQDETIPRKKSEGHRGYDIGHAVTRDVNAIRELVGPYAEQRILIAKDAVAYYESLSEFRVAREKDTGRVIGCGALHVMWEDLAEIRTLAVASDALGQGVGGALVSRLLDDAVAIGVSRVFCLTFEVDFFARHGFQIIEGQAVEPEVYLQLLRSYDEGIAEFLDLERVKPNILGNTRMLRIL